VSVIQTVTADEGCRRCRLSEFRFRQVMGRGSLPCDLLFVGEGPGRTEDVRGLAFCGPTKRVLDEAQEWVCRVLGLSRFPSCYFTNVVQCRPCDGREGPNREPSGEEALACRPNLEAVYLAARPKRVLFLGRVAQRNCAQLWPEGIPLQHPAYLLRRGGAECPEFRVFCRQLEETVRSLRAESRARLVRRGGRPVR